MDVFYFFKGSVGLQAGIAPICSRAFCDILTFTPTTAYSLYCSLPQIFPALIHTSRLYSYLSLLSELHWSPVQNKAHHLHLAKCHLPAWTPSTNHSGSLFIHKPNTYALTKKESETLSALTTYSSICNPHLTVTILAEICSVIWRTSPSAISHSILVQGGFA